MPGRPLRFELGLKSNTVCRSCLLTLRQRSSIAPWSASFSSQPPRAARSRHPLSRNAPRKTAEADMQPVIQKLEAASKSRPDHNYNFTVNYFEQNGPAQKELPGPQAFDESVSGITSGSELRHSLQTMRNSVGSREEKMALDKLVSRIGPLLDNVHTSKDLEAIMANLKADSARLDSELDQAVQDFSPGMAEELRKELSLVEDNSEPSGLRVRAPQIPEKLWTPNQRKKIARLNAAMKNASREQLRGGGFSNKAIIAVYKAYHAARLALAHSWSTVQLDVWDYLWNILSTDEPSNTNRLAHISMLARDMSEAKVTLSPSQQLLTIEAVFVDGWESKAIDNWRRCMSTLGNESSETFKDFWELGVRMYCRVNDIDQAERAVSKLLERDMDARILLPIIRTYSEMGTVQGRENAWTAYRQMRQLLGRNMELSDYDQVVSSFLMTNQVSHALYVFVDMMSDGQIDLKEQKHMPSVVANKFFLGKWLKRLIGAGDLDGAYNVVEFMREKGVSASAIQLNGLIGAWQRSGGAEDLAKADGLAWGMIESRINFVRARNANERNTVNVAQQSDIPPLPRATRETFSLLAEDYRVRELHGKLGDLWDAFRDAEITVDAFMMNQLLESYVDANQSKQALDLYKTLVTEKGVTPDPYTFTSLWKTLRVNRLYASSSSSADVDTQEARDLFAEMVRFKDVFLPEGMSGQLARKILHTFRRLKDNSGFLVALTALKGIFQFKLPEPLVMELVINTTGLAWETPAQRRRLILAKRDMDRDLMAWAEGDVTKLDGENRGAALYEYLQRQYWPKDGDEQNHRKALVEVTKQMGVYDLLRPGGSVAQQDSKDEN